MAGLTALGYIKRTLTIGCDLFEWKSKVRSTATATTAAAAYYTANVQCSTTVEGNWHSLKCWLCAAAAVAVAISVIAAMTNGKWSIRNVSE